MSLTYSFEGYIEYLRATDAIKEAMLDDVAVFNPVAKTIECDGELAYEAIGYALQDVGTLAPQEREDQFCNDVEADADALSSAGMGTDEDYEHNSFDAEE